MRRFLRWLAPLLIAGALCVPCLRAQPPTQPSTGVQPAPAEPTTRRLPVLEYALAIIATLLVLLILCKPSRKV